MELKEAKEQGVLILSLTGRLGASDVKPLKTRVLELLDGGEKTILFDLAELDYINSGGLGVLTLTFQRLKSDGGFGLCCVKDYIMEVLDISGYSKIFPLYDSTEEGVGALSS